MFKRTSTDNSLRDLSPSEPFWAPVWKLSILHHFHAIVKIYGMKRSARRIIGQIRVKIVQHLAFEIVADVMS